MLLWRDVSFGTLVGGSVIGLLIEVARSRSDRHGSRVDPVGMARFIVHYIWMVFASNARVAWEVIAPQPAHPGGDRRLPTEERFTHGGAGGRQHRDLHPGTLSVELTDDPRTLYVHVLQFTDAEQVRDSVSELEDLVLQRCRNGRTVRLVRSLRRTDNLGMNRPHRPDAPR
jgi:multisubunit Na+/H+ antiporter MnhE subunit